MTLGDESMHDDASCFLLITNFMHIDDGFAPQCTWFIFIIFYSWISVPRERHLTRTGGDMMTWHTCIFSHLLRYIFYTAV